MAICNNCIKVDVCRYKDYYEYIKDAIDKLQSYAANLFEISINCQKGMTVLDMRQGLTTEKNESKSKEVKTQ